MPLRPALLLLVVPLALAAQDDTVTYATPRTPVDTCLLRSQNQNEVNPPVGFRVEGAAFNPTEYAPYVHDGTRFMEARPFLVEGATIAAQRLNFEFERT